MQDYFTPENYEIEEWSRPDEMRMFFSLWMHARGILDTLHDARVVDLCCGTGIPSLGIVSHPHIASFTGVDIDAASLTFAQKRFSALPRMRFVHEDALVHLRDGGPYDLVILCSSYHHIQHSLKRDFTQLVAGALSERGRVVVAENILLPYEVLGTPEYYHGVEQFYAAVLEAARDEFPALPSPIEKLIRENVSVSLAGIAEYKVDMRTFLADFASAGLKMLSLRRVWPITESVGAQWGNYLAVFSR